jgi:hypothetical protein
VHAEVGARTPAEVLAEPARKVADVSDPPYGRFYEKLLETLQKQVMQKLELK